MWMFPATRLRHCITWQYHPITYANKHIFSSEPHQPTQRHKTAGPCGLPCQAHIQQPRKRRAQPWRFAPEIGGKCDTTWISKMAKIMDPVLPTVSILRFWAIILGALLEVPLHTIQASHMRLIAEDALNSLPRDVSPVKLGAILRSCQHHRDSQC